MIIGIKLSIGFNKKQEKFKYSEKRIIGNSDYSRNQIENETSGFTIGLSAKSMLIIIELYEEAGYFVYFETSFFRKIFGIGIYRIVAYKLKQK